MSHVCKVKINFSKIARVHQGDGAGIPDDGHVIACHCIEATTFRGGGGYEGGNACLFAAYAATTMHYFVAGTDRLYTAARPSRGHKGLVNLFILFRTVLGPSSFL